MVNRQIKSSAKIKKIAKNFFQTMKASFKRQTDVVKRMCLYTSGF